MTGHRTWKLRAIKWLLWRADSLICSLPTPSRPEGDYFDRWAALGDVHRAIGRAYETIQER